MLGEVIISDTSCLIVLYNSGQIDLLRLLFSNVVVTPEIADEFGMPLPDWIQLQTATDSTTQRFLETQLDVGEASAISLALEHKSSLLLIDERKGRAVATEMGLRIMGTARVLILARSQNLIPSLRDALTNLVEQGFRLSPRLIEEVLDKYGD
jgi:predicted nucleic acid-binding protein